MVLVVSINNFLEKIKTQIFKKKLRLSSGERVCDLCKGKKKFVFTSKFLENKKEQILQEKYKVQPYYSELKTSSFFIMIDIHKRKYYCPKCKGFGKLNWLEGVFGKSSESIMIDEDIFGGGPYEL